MSTKHCAWLEKGFLKVIRSLFSKSKNIFMLISHQEIQCKQGKQDTHSHGTDSPMKETVNRVPSMLFTSCD